MVEFVMVMPLMGAFLAFAVLFFELGHARLRTQEAARFAAWRVTASPLADWKGAEHERAADEAVFEAEREAVRLHPARVSFSGWSAAVEVRLREEGLPLRAKAIDLRGTPASVMRFAKLGLPGMLDAWRFAQRGRFEAEARAEVVSPWLTAFMSFVSRRTETRPRRWELVDRAALIAGDWHLPEGGDHTLIPSGRLLGAHGSEPGGFFRQLQRMSFSGGEGLIPRDGQAVPLLVRPWVSNNEAFGPFLASHNYRPTSAGGPRCAGVHPAKDGMRNLDAQKGPDNLLDQVNEPAAEDNDALRCFDTAPFRDTARYADSLYLQLFQSRGPFFMGCRRAQADDPSDSVGSTPALDANSQKVSCQ